MGASLKATRYFEEQVLRKRPYIQRDWCRDVLASPIRRQVQTDGRIRFWGRIVVSGEELQARIDRRIKLGFLRGAAPSRLTIQISSAAPAVMSAGFGLSPARLAPEPRT